MSRVISCIRSSCLSRLKYMPTMRNCSQRFFFGGPRDPFTVMSSAMRSMERQMRELDREMNKVFDEFSRSSPVRLGSPFWWREGKDVPVRIPGDNENAYRVTLDVSNYQPENIKVTVKDHKLTVRAKQEETTSDGSKVQREFTHESTLPEDVNVEAVRSELNANGILVIEAPLKPTALPKEIPVTNENTEEKKD